MQQITLLQSDPALRRIPFYLVDEATEKIPQTGIVFSTGEIKICKNGGAETNHAGFAFEVDGGMYYYQPNSGEIDTRGFLSIRFVKSGVRTFVAVVQIDYERAAQESLTSIMAVLLSVKDKTDNLPVDPADASDIAASFAAVNTKVDTIDDFLDTEIAAIKAKTDNLPDDPADASDIAASFAVVNAGLTAIADQTALIPSEPISVGDIPTAIEIADAYLTRVDGVEPGWTPQEQMRITLAASAGKLSGAATPTVLIRDAGDSKNRITASTDEVGNRLAVTYDKS